MGLRAVTKSAERSGLFSRLRALDILIIAAVLLLSLLAFLFLPEDGDWVTVTWHGEQIYRGRLETDATITTPDSLNTIRISEGCVYMESSTCGNQLCVKLGAASASRPIVCIPNQVVVTISDDSAETEVDSVSW